MSKPPTQLLVRSEFDGHSVGDRITSAAAMKAALASHPDHVLREPVPEEVETEKLPAAETVVVGDATPAVTTTHVIHDAKKK